MFKLFKSIIKIYQRFFWSDEKYARHIGVKIGKDCCIATRFFSSEPYLIEIGDHVQITDDVVFLTHSGGWIFRKENPTLDSFGKIKVGNNVYIGNRAIILPGVHIGNNVIIGAGAVVTKSIEDGMVVAGNPAKPIKSIKEVEAKMKKFDVMSKLMTPREKKKYLLGLSEERFINK